MVRRQVCIQRTRNGGLGMHDLESHWLAERLAYLGRSLSGDTVWRQKAIPFLASSQTQSPKVVVGRWAKHCLSAYAVWPFVNFLGPVTFLGLGKNCIRN